MEPEEIKLFLAETLAGRYRPDGHIASGGFAGTFRADDETGEFGEVAVKILRLSRASSPDALQEFQDEVRFLRDLGDCDRVVDLIDAGTHTVHLDHPASGGSIPVPTEFCVLELAAGSLAALILKGSSFGWPDRLALFRDVAKGVHQMHLRGMVHRDTKAENALVFENPQIAKIADLGRAHNTTEPARFDVNSYLAGRGDLRLAPPEFLWLQGTTGAEDQALADVYLLGALLFEVATGTFLTSATTGNPFAVVQKNVALTADERRVAWMDQIPWLREAARPAYATFAAEVPTPIRNSLVGLLQVLTDPDPGKRIPTLGGGRTPLGPWDLEWLLARVDGLRRAIDPAFRHAYLASRRRTTRPHGAPRR
jgi:eukaryotic-like serine/threonine-protein kinase